MKYTSMVELIGNTPLVRLKGLENLYGLDFALYGKLEMYNPLGSVKDRLALALVRDAIERGLLEEDPEKNKDKVWVEATSGNTGIGLAFLSLFYGFKLIVTMPESMSDERKRLLAYLGAEVVLTPAEEGISGAVRTADLIAKNTGAYIPGQFTNPANPEFHYRTTGPEIWNQTEGKVEAFIAGYGTGGTVSGVSLFLKERNPAIMTLTVEPEESPVVTKGQSGPHGIQGIGPGFIPKTLDLSVIDRVVTVSTEEAIETSMALTAADGIFAGISAGAAISATVKLKEELSGKLVVAILPDTGERYLSTKLFDNDRVRKRIISFEEWRKKHGLSA
jgi:cysteine synthase A